MKRTTAVSRENRPYSADISPGKYTNWRSDIAVPSEVRIKLPTIAFLKTAPSFTRWRNIVREYKRGHCLRASVEQRNEDYKRTLKPSPDAIQHRAMTKMRHAAAPAISREIFCHLRLPPIFPGARATAAPARAQ